MAKGKSPAFQFYPDSWLSSTDICLMTPAEEGAYIRLLCVAWMEEDCGLPDDDEILAKLSRLGKAWYGKSGKKIRRKFTEVGGRLFNDRLIEERQKQDRWARKSAEGGRLSALKREEARKGGSTTLQPPLNGGCEMVDDCLQPNANSSIEEEKEEPISAIQSKEPLPSDFDNTVSVNGNERFKADRDDAWKWFVSEYPGELKTEWDAQMFASSVQTFDDIFQLRRNLPEWKQTRKWLDGFAPTAENYLRKRQFRDPPRPEAPILSKQQRSVNEWDSV